MIGADQCAVLELRQYTLHPGKRDDLIDLFEAALIEPQESAGMRVIAQFRDLRDPDRFVWLRGFRNMDERRDALATFYGGPVWKQHRDRANATMMDSDDVLLLRPAHPHSGFPEPATSRPLPESEVPAAWYAASVHFAKADHLEELAAFFEQEVEPLLVGAGAERVAVLVTEQASNTFPALPVRANERCVAWFARFGDAEAHGRYVTRLEESRRWNEEVLPELRRRSAAPSQELMLAPASRSWLR